MATRIINEGYMLLISVRVMVCATYIVQCLHKDFFTGIVSRGGTGHLCI